ncbi:uncharacterized protein DUF4011 [Tamaricihabitans halophyticus]|uniref:Uncharacterized protein DUF4011 n=1 Tax=Tamaricihabitans halophyticus TaxID=1262583 RepID=A0A4R2QT15_9PSEU|nr:AAA domain-containing protein [Tamaricihabitans halophyticus]TCP53050.1 uncharacterized protein DUF4011 [Tamaricihabitans halophyticus]
MLGDGRRVELLQRKAAEWARDLIDLDHRNTLLNFKNTKTTSLDLTSCNPAELSSLAAGRKTSLRSLFGTQDDYQDACVRARNLHRRIAMFRDEQGVEIGRLAYGLLRTQPPKSGTRPVLSLRAPLLLRSIVLHPKTAAESDFALQAGTEIELNQVLLHGLQREYGAELDADEVTAKVTQLVDGLVDVSEQVEQVYQELAPLVSRLGIDVELEQAIVVGLFNYQKLPMVQDLQAATDLLAGHDLIAALAGDQRAVEDVRAVAAGFVEPDVGQIKPENEFLVADADSSQHAAIDTALAGQHLMIEGPPGTGKSQTIANIIAGAAAQGLRVLFVAEKRAAIEAVTQRLGEVGLAELVLDLHQSKIDKKHIAEQLNESLSKVTTEGVVDAAEVHRRLADCRTKLDEHVHELHELRQPWGLSAFAVWNELIELDDHHRTSCAFRGEQLRALDGHVVAEVEDALREFIELGGLRVLRQETPWWQAEVREEDLERVVAELDDLAGNILHDSTDRMHRLVAQAGLPVPATIANWQEVLELLDQVATSVQNFDPDIFGDSLDALHYATAPRRVRAQFPQQVPWRQRRALVKQARVRCRQDITKKQRLHEELSAVVKLRYLWQKLAGPHSRPAQVVGLAEMMADYQRLRRQLAAVALSAKLEPLETRPTVQVSATLEKLAADKQTLYKLPAIARLRTRLNSLGLGRFLDEVARRDAGAEQARRMFRHTWLRCLDDQFRIDSPALRSFTVEQQSRLTEEFRRLDVEHREMAARRVRRRVAVDARKARDTFPDERKLLKDQASKRRGHLPLRKLVERAPNVLLSLRPCWAMSPLVVSQTLPATTLFDMVIFDEASQIKPHDAITSIMRGKRLVVSGDENQLPPSSWFDRLLGGEDDDEDEQSDLGHYESILTSLRPVIPHSRRLRWHYRSEDERLIAFSNKEIYDGDLVTFPAAVRENPLRLEIVDGVSSPGQGGLPAEEVHRVVELTLAHAEQRPDESLGIITLGTKHRDRLDQAIRLALRERADVNDFFAEDAGATRRFFVKNIETVQGDERDAIILAVGVAKRASGVVDRRGFGALNSEGAERRLNVAVTRAKRRMTVVSSFPPGALAPSENVSGTELLRRYLEVAAADGDPAKVGRLTGTESNAFERDIADRLQDKGIMVYPQWGVSEYRIDLALEHPDVAGQMVLAVEADGDRYHRSISARDRDRLRQEHLERLGWRFHRVWASAWFADPEGETARIVAAWRKAVAGVPLWAPQAELPNRPAARVDLHTPGTSPLAESASPPMRTSARRNPRPDVPYGLGISGYSDTELIGLCRWLISDELQLDRDERIGQAMGELGFQKRGRKIVERLGRAVEIAQHLADEEEG